MKEISIRNEPCVICYMANSGYSFNVDILYDYTYIPARLYCAWEDSYPEDECFDFTIKSIDWCDTSQADGLSDELIDELFINVKNELAELDENYIQYRVLELYNTDVV